MKPEVRKSRVGFAVIKLMASGIPYYLMRVNPKWKDINFIGGHEKLRDGADLRKTARRELWEEVPSIRNYANLDLEPLTTELRYGPIYSRSKGDQVEYDVKFFLLRMEGSPASLIELLSLRTKNIWVSQQELLRPNKYRLSGLVAFLNGAVHGGLDEIPYSSPVDMRSFQHCFDYANGRQLEFALK